MMVCWLSERPMNLNTKYTLRHTTNDVKCLVKELRYKMDISSLEKIRDVNSLALNEIGKIKVRTTKPLFFDSYRSNRITGSVILVEEGTNNTVGAGMII
jgi:sulfate adenylyltransferase subunit 1